MRKTLVNLALLATLALLPALPGCGRGQTVSGGTGAAAPSVPPEFNKEITTLEGVKTTLAKYQGKVVSVNFWATGAIPPRRNPLVHRIPEKVRR
jgi:hypothetical protein